MVLQTSAVKLQENQLSGVVISVSLKLLTILAKSLRCLTGAILAGGYNSRNSNGDISLTGSKDGIILINSLYLKFRSVNCLSVIRQLKQLLKVLVCYYLEKYLENFLQIIFKAFLTEFAFSKIPCFHQILGILNFRHSSNMNTTKPQYKTFRWK